MLSADSSNWSMGLKGKEMAKEEFINVRLSERKQIDQIRLSVAYRSPVVLNKIKTKKLSSFYKSLYSAPSGNRQ